MRYWMLVCGALMLQPVAAEADCQGDIAVTTARAKALPATTGRAALMEQIQRAEIARHEGDEGDCRDQLSMATDVLDKIDANKRREAASH